MVVRLGILPALLAPAADRCLNRGGEKASKGARENRKVFFSLEKPFSGESNVSSLEKV